MMGLNQSGIRIVLFIEFCLATERMKFSLTALSEQFMHVYELVYSIVIFALVCITLLNIVESKLHEKHKSFFALLAKMLHAQNAQKGKVLMCLRWRGRRGTSCIYAWFVMMTIARRLALRKIETKLCCINNCHNDNGAELTEISE